VSAVRENCFASPELCLSLCLRDASGRLAYRRKLTIGACEVSLVTPSVVQRLGGQRLRSAGQQEALRRTVFQKSIIECKYILICQAIVYARHKIASM